MDKIIVVAFFGKAGTGKSSLSNYLMKFSNNSERYNLIVSSTTRPPRQGEIDGKDYHFISEEDWKKQDFLEETVFRDWHYGTSFLSLNEMKINIGVFNIEGIKSLMKFDDLLVIPIQLVSGDKCRIMRQLNREYAPDCAEICRRFLTDEADFQPVNLDFGYYTLENNMHTKYADLMMRAERLIEQEIAPSWSNQAKQIV